MWKLHQWRSARRNRLGQRMFDVVSQVHHMSLQYYTYYNISYIVINSYTYIYILCTCSSSSDKREILVKSQPLTGPPLQQQAERHPFPWRLWSSPSWTLWSQIHPRNTRMEVWKIMFLSKCVICIDFVGSMLIFQGVKKDDHTSHSVAMNCIIATVKVAVLKGSER